jgi:hypothetical protein
VPTRRSVSKTTAPKASQVGKAILTNIGALNAKYGDRMTDVQGALDALIAADAKRGLTTQVIALDDPKVMKPFGAPAVTDRTDPQQAKAAIDGVYRALTPSYLMILGATDVVPHQPLANPMFSPDGDPDDSAYGDLPYACDAPYSVSAGDFVGPTRVLGRLPDVTGDSDPSYLLGLLQTAADWQSRSKDDYLSALGVSAKVWEGSTRLSMQIVFGSDTDLNLSPTKGPKWPASLLSRRVHFINCHGAESDSHFYGQEGGSYPVAHDADLVSKHVTEGTVVAAECCYGAELYDPKPVQGVPGLCNTYLGSGAYGFFGSSTIAYGPAEGNGSADLLCQYFIRYVLEGASLGRATLQARQDFVSKVTVVDPADLKTLAQFSLMGDPSIHPVLPQTDQVAIAGDAKQKRLPESALLLLRGRTGRRANLAAAGAALSESAAVARVPVETEGDRATMNRILRLAGVSGLRGRKMFTFDVDRPVATATGAKSVPWAKALPPAPTPRVHVVVGRTRNGDAPVQQLVAIVAKESNGTLVAFRKLFGK